VRAWLHEDWRRPGPPKKPTAVRFFPDYLADLPVWGVDWLNPPFSRELLVDLVRWQDEFDDHGTEQWPETEWTQWVDDAAGLVRRVRRELGPGVQVEVLWPPLGGDG
jgi:hypothetical protein